MVTKGDAGSDVREVVSIGIKLRRHLEGGSVKKMKAWGRSSGKSMDFLMNTF